MLKRSVEKIQNRQPLRIALYGDSISEVDRTPGYFGGASSFEMNWGQQLKRLLQKEYPGQEFIIQHFGAGGHNTYEALGRLDYLLPLKPDLVLIELGANDCGWHELSPAQSGVALERMIECLEFQLKCDIVILGVAGDNPAERLMKHHAETFAAQKQVAEKHQFPFVDLLSASARATKNGERWAEYHNGRQDCHPNDKGHVVWADAVFEVLKRHLPLAGRFLVLGGCATR
ncbi:MAG TPA: SGNH/GDSL hydrolase family protein [Tepidisphaeraceae bacterium]|jgi:lysophospholipase L1-like esterase